MTRDAFSQTRWRRRRHAMMTSLAVIRDRHTSRDDVKIKNNLQIENFAIRKKLFQLNWNQIEIWILKFEPKKSP